MIESPTRPDGAWLRLLLLRHGEPEDSARGRCYGKLDVALSERGRSQALAAAIGLRSAGIDAVYASPSLRARETASVLSHDSGVETRIDPRLAEIDFGTFEGMTYDEARERFPNLYRAWMTRPNEVVFPEGESFADIERRVSAALADIRERHRGETVAIVSHGGVNRIALGEALALPPESIFRLGQSYASISIIDYYEGSPSVALMNGVFPC